MRSNHQYNYNYKLDQIYYREKSYDLHLKKLNEIKTKKTQSQQRVQHLEILQKRNNLRQQRKRFDLNQYSERIDKGNIQLYQKIKDISNRTMQQDYYKYEDDNLNHSHYLNLTFRKHQAQEIQNENIKIADRLMKQEPVLKVQEFSHSYKENKKMMIRLQRYQQGQNYMNIIRNNMTYQYKDSLKNSSINSKRKEKHQLSFQLQPINNQINILNEIKDKRHLLQELKKSNDYQITPLLSQIPQVNEESQIETIGEDETFEQQIQIQIDKVVKQYQNEQQQK